MQKRLVVLLLLVGLAGAAYPTLGAPPGPPVTRHVTLTVEQVDCGEEVDRICLAYNGQIPGPTLDVNLGDTLVVTLVNEHTAPVSFHTHGMVLSAAMDGVAAHAGTELIESVAPAGGSFTYTVRAGFAGAWHYHDHVLGHDGSEGVRRGLYGGIIVRNGAEQRHQAVFDAHVLDAGVNGGRGLYATTNATSFEILVAGLGNTIVPVSLRGPSGATIDSATIGPGLSDRLQVNATTPGVYTLRAPNVQGTITVVAP